MQTPKNIDEHTPLGQAHVHTVLAHWLCTDRQEQEAPQVKNLPGYDNANK